tara:strand:- start:5412 stop:6131 length:720 start_codon:yes stop_codon:yes gene_type:complete
MRQVLLTFDIDWAPDFAIKPIVEFLIKKEIPSIWFVTHNSIVLDQMRDRPDLFELGIHPNFFPNSTQGSNENDIFENLIKIVPEARCMRTHGLYQSSNLILNASKKYNIKYDFSQFLPFNNIHLNRFFYKDMSIERMPYNWEDDISIYHPLGLKQSCNLILEMNQIVLDFHPIHCFLNTTKIEKFEKVKNRISENMNSMEALKNSKETTFGVFNAFDFFISIANTEIEIKKLNNFLISK